MSTVGKGWSDVASAYATTFEPLCAGAIPALLDQLDAAGLSSGGSAGSRALDVGTGTGRLAQTLVQRGSRVVAVDPDPAMVRLAASRAPGATVLDAGLPDLPFRNGAFDFVTANFVVNHLPDPRAGVFELVRVTRPGGIVAATIWPTGETVQSRVWAQVLTDAGAVVPPTTRLAPHLDFARSEEGLRGLLDRAGIGEFSTSIVRWEFRADPDVIWRGASAGIGGMGSVLAAQDEATRERMRAAYVRIIAPLVHDGELVLPSRAVLGVGVRGTSAG